jgi:hypothetical protein
MKEKQIKAIKATLGDDIFDVLEKTELLKLQTKTMLDPHEVKIALSIVPRTILTYLMLHLKPMPNGSFLDLVLPFAEGNMHINKLSNDVYSGEIFDKEHKKVAEFKHRSLPSVGLVILSTFELYDFHEQQEPTVTIAVKPDQNTAEDSTHKLQLLIDERLQLHNLIGRVVDEKITEREAMHRMLMLKLKEVLVHSEPQEEIMSKKHKLKEFLDKRNKKEHNEEIDKSEDLECPDCATIIYKSGENHIKCCICYGEWRNKEIKFTKNEGNIKFKFPKTFDVENIEMLLSALKNKKK